MHYVEMDDLLNCVIARHFFGKKRNNRRGKNQNTLELMLDRLYPQQKLDIVKTFVTVPSHISTHIMALNGIRNCFAHRYDLAESPNRRDFTKASSMFLQRKA